MGIVVGAKLATLHELQTVYSYEDLLDLYEIVYINGLNEEIAAEEVRHG